MCALLISVITLSGATNRSFRTEMEQWNPIGITQDQSGPQTTNRLTAGSAILPTVAMVAPSGVLRGGSTNVITFTTSKAVEKTIFLYMEYSGDKPTLSGLDGTPKSGEWRTYTLTSQTVTITGDVTFFYCEEKQLTTLDVSNNTALKKLVCRYSQLTSLNVSKCTELTELDCTKNQLTALDVSQNTALKSLDCFGNQIKGEEMTRLVNSLPDRTGKEAGEIVVVQEPALEGNICLKSDVAIAKSKNWNTKKYKSDTKEYVFYEGEGLIMSFTTAKAVGETVNLQMNYTGAAPTLSGATGTPESGTEVAYKLTSQTVTIQGDVTELYCNGNQLTTLDISQNPALTELYCSNNQLKALDVSRNTAIEKLYCTNNQLTTLDLSQNTALIRLYCYNNQLTSLDVSKNTALTRLACFNNQLTALDLSQNTALTNLDCSDNQLTALDVSKNTALTELDCFNNQLTTLDVSKNTALGKLDCYNNQLKALDVSQNTKLGTLDCRGNQIKGGEMTRLVNSLPDRKGKYAGRFTVVQSDAESNRCLKSDVAIAKSKNWDTQKYNSDTKNSVPYVGEEPIPYAVTLTKEGEGTLTATGAADLNAVPEGSELTIVATPADGYELKALTANGTDILATKKFTVTADTEVKATFTKKTYAVTLTKEGEGTLTATGAADLNAVPEGTELTIEATPAEGYELTALTANDTDILATKKVVVKGATEVKATFAKKTFAVTLTKEGEGTLAATGADNLTAVPYGTELTIEATPADGYELKALTANGTDILATKKIVVTDNMTVKATFTKKSYTVTFTPEGEGKLAATKNGEPFTSGSPAYEGDKIVITAQPAEGYQIDKWLIGKEEIEFTPYTGQTTFECTVGTADVLIKATFTKKTAADAVESSSVRLYPNPASAYVNVKGAKADALVRLYDANGSLRYEARTDADGTLQIDLSAYAEGTYLLRVGDDAQRLLIQR